MGLVARVLEAGGIATVSLSMIPEFTVAVGAPRVAGIDHPMSRPMGRPHDVDGQRAVLRAALELLTSATTPGTLAYLPFVWPESARAARREVHVNPPIAQLLKHKPWLIPRFVSGDIPHADEEAPVSAR